MGQRAYLFGLLWELLDVSFGTFNFKKPKNSLKPKSSILSKGTFRLLAHRSFCFFERLQSQNLKVQKKLKQAGPKSILWSSIISGYRKNYRVTEPRRQRFFPFLSFQATARFYLLSWKFMSGQIRFNHAMLQQKHYLRLLSCRS